MKDLIAHVLSPHRTVRVLGKAYKIRQNISWELKEEAQALSDAFVRKCRFDKMLRRSQIEPILQRMGFAVDTLPELYERAKTLKKDLYRKYPDIVAQRPFRYQLQSLKSEVTKLQSEIGLLDTHTLEFLADKIGYFHCLKGSILKCSREHRNDYSFMEKVYFEMLRQTVSVGELRHLSRNDFWRSHWCVRKVGIFRYHPLTEEQLALSSYSTMYDNIFNHHEAPPQAIIDDDDMLDGWLLIQQEDRKKDKQPTYGHKIDSAREVFVMAQDQEHANAIYNMNTPEQRTIQRSRQQQLTRHGKLGYGQFADVRNK